MKITRLSAAAMIAPLALVLSACEKEEPVPATDDKVRGAEGEVLGGTISDDMIDYEAIESRAPTLKEDPEGDTSSQSSADDEDEGDSGD